MLPSVVNWTIVSRGDYAKMAYKRVRGWTSARSLPVLNFVKYPLPGGGGGILSQIKLLFGPLVIQLVWYILKQLFTSVLVKVVDIYLHFGE